AEDGIRDFHVTGVQTCALPISTHRMTFPLSASDARTLRAGDQVIIDGEIIITAGLPTHARFLDCLDGKEAFPMDLQGASLFHLEIGRASCREGRRIAVCGVD